MTLVNKQRQRSVRSEKDLFILDTDEEAFQWRKLLLAQSKSKSKCQQTRAFLLAATHSGPDTTVLHSKRITMQRKN